MRLIALLHYSGFMVQHELRTGIWTTEDDVTSCLLPNLQTSGAGSVQFPVAMVNVQQLVSCDLRPERPPRFLTGSRAPGPDGGVDAQSGLSSAESVCVRVWRDGDREASEYGIKLKTDFTVQNGGQEESPVATRRL
ncbi:hypothetical protein AOLI_G00153430 [Acnodon oligacanthus]